MGKDKGERAASKIRSLKYSDESSYCLQPPCVITMTSIGHLLFQESFLCVNGGSDQDLDNDRGSSFPGNMKSTCSST